MPLYLYEHPETHEVIELLQSVHDKHEYVLKGTAWLRRWTAPQISSDTKLDPFNGRKFVEKTAKAGNYGDLVDRAGELGHLRAEKNGGIDPLTGKAPLKRNQKKRSDKALPTIPDFSIG